MSEFAEMLKEAILGEEPYRPDRGRQALEASVAKFERRMRTVRLMALVMVTFASAVFVTGLVLFLGADAEATVPNGHVFPKSRARSWSSSLNIPTPGGEKRRSGCSCNARINLSLPASIPSLRFE